MYNQLYEEENKKSFKKLLTYMGNKKKSFKIYLISGNK